MSELSIAAGHNHYDPLRDVIDEAAKLAPGEDELLSERCSDVYEQALLLLTQIPGSGSHIGHADVTIRTPEIAYDTIAGSRGYLWLSADFKQANDSAPGFDSRGHRVRLLLAQTTDVAQVSPVMSISRRDILYATGIFLNLDSTASLTSSKIY